MHLAASVVECGKRSTEEEELAVPRQSTLRLEPCIMYCVCTYISMYSV